MKDLKLRSISSIFYVIIMLSALIHPVSFMIVMYISAIIVLAEYGKVLRKDTEHLYFLKRWNQDHTPFMSTEFFPMFMVTALGLLPLGNVFYYIIILYLIFYPFLLFFLISKRKFYGYFTSKAWPIFLLTLSLILLVSSPSLNIDFKKFQIYMIAYLVLIWGIDSAGYFIGLKFGKKKLYESVSPKKTIEGVYGSIIFTLIFGFYLGQFFQIDSLLSIASSLMICFFAIMGDLIQSKIKRQLKVKDFGNWIKGHGGLFDRLDSIIFSFPFFLLIIIIFENVS
ncbi:MAG: phosphatidate cytidylyltransferase [Flavobacteriaceae bacterium]